MDRHWQKPPVWSAAAGVLLLALGATAGGSLVFQDQFYTVAKPIVAARPVVHALTGIPAIDEAKITETVEQSNRSFRMLHVHGLLIPFYGFDALRFPIEYGIFPPFGGSAIVGLWGTGLSYLFCWGRGWAREGAVAHGV